MYGIDKKVEFLMAKNAEVFPNGQELMVQVAWPHIVARVRKFSSTETQERMRQEWTERKGEGVPMVQHPTHRVYVELVGTLSDVRRDRIERHTGMDNDRYVISVLDRMAAYAVSQMTEGQLYAYSWDREIVDDDFFKRLWRARKNGE